MVALVDDERIPWYRSRVNVISTEEVYEFGFCRGGFLRWNEANIIRCSA